MNRCANASIYNCAICARVADCQDVPIEAIDRDVKRALVALGIVVFIIACLCVAP
jgi:hypothetical protein